MLEGMRYSFVMPHVLNFVAVCNNHLDIKSHTLTLQYPERYIETADAAITTMSETLQRYADAMSELRLQTLKDFEYAEQRTATWLNHFESAAHDGVQKIVKSSETMFKSLARMQTVSRYHSILGKES